MNRLLVLLSRLAFLRFAIIGGLGVPVDAGVLYLMLNAVGSSYSEGRSVSWFCAVTFTWFGNRYFTFRSARARGLGAMGREWAKFVAANAVGGLVNVGLSIALKNFAPSPFNNPYVALACGVLAGLAFNFMLSKKLVFKGPI
jgi:putative flippase GtrA